MMFRRRSSHEILLYQFPHSHFSEKARWALERKGVGYRKVNLVRGPHAWLARRLGCHDTTVPILVHEGVVVQDSTAIIDFLEARYPTPALAPSSPSLRREARELEEQLDEQLGFHGRRYLYCTLLKHRRLVSGFFLQGRSPAWRHVFALLFPVVRASMVRKMHISAGAARSSEAELRRVFAMLNRRLEGRAFLVGSRLSRADITAAALLSPLVWPPEHDFAWPSPDDVPEPLRGFVRSIERERFYGWARDLYARYRRSMPSPSGVHDEPLSELVDPGGGGRGRR